MFFKRKEKFPKNTKYKKDDYVNFRYKGELYFGYIYMAYIGNNHQVTYTIQVAGQCPFFIYDYKEEDIIGLRIKK